MAKKKTISSSRNALQLHKRDTFGDAARKTLQRQFARMLQFESPVRRGRGPDPVHDMRVSARRLRAALRVFGKVLPARQAEHFTKEIRWLGGSLGKVRDLDVQLQQFDEDAKTLPIEQIKALRKHRARLVQNRRTAQSQLKRCLSSTRYGRLKSGFTTFVKHPADMAASKTGKPVLKKAASTLDKLNRRVLSDGKEVAGGLEDAAMHQLRIRCKKLRYACEFFSGLYGRRMARLIRRLTALQDALGLHQDSIVARQDLSCLRRAQVRRSRGSANSYVDAIDMLMKCHTQRAKESQAEFLKLWRDFERSAKKRAAF